MDLHPVLVERARDLGDVAAVELEQPHELGAQRVVVCDLRTGPQLRASEREIGDVDGAPRGDRRRGEGALELAHVVRPVVAVEQPGRGGRELRAFGAGPPGEALKIDQIPSELSSQSLNLEDQSSNVESMSQDAEQQPRDCSVKLLFCHDPRHGGARTYCSNGCSGGEAYATAVRLCNQVCGNIDCSSQLNLGGC